MARFAQAMVVTGLVVGAMVGATHVVAANPIQDYREIMRAFVPDVQAWASETSTLIDAAATKPELGCSDAMVELARRGVWASQDMAGTARLAPSSLSAKHNGVTAAMEKLTRAAQNSCGDSVGSAALSVQAMGEFRRALAPIRYFIGGPRQVPEIPVQSVSGN